MKKIVVQCRPDITQAVVTENHRLVEFDVQHLDDKQRTGSIYLGRVVNVLPGMQAAFVDIGLEKNAFLYIDDLLPVNMEKQPRSKPSIADVVKRGQVLMVQVVKEPEGTKGARITTHFSIPGRWIVYMPDADYTAVSRKIDSEAEKLRLKDIAENLRSDEEGIIIRTVAAGQSKQALERDLTELRELWNNVKEKAESGEAPLHLYQDLDLLPRLMRDVIDDDVHEVWIDNEQVCKEMRELLERQSPDLVGRVQLYSSNDQVAIFDAYGIHDELNRLFRRKVWLPSGGYLVIDPTEALTVVDVNTGRFTGSTHLEETVFHTNMEAVTEIARLLRLRNIRGMIIVDFIDMSVEANQLAILDAFGQAVLSDRSKTIIVGWTKLGLLEITRKRK